MQRAGDASGHVYIVIRVYGHFKLTADQSLIFEFPAEQVFRLTCVSNIGSNRTDLTCPYLRPGAIVLQQRNIRAACISLICKSTSDIPGHKDAIAGIHRHYPGNMKDKISVITELKKRRETHYHSSNFQLTSSKRS